jgi:hypothetical protein
MNDETKTTAISHLKNPPPREASLPAVRAGFFDLQGFELLQRVSKAFASSSLVPKQYQGDVANCMIALNLARRLQADELMVMQNLYVVHGSPGWSSKFLIASVNTCGRYSTMRYEWRGKAGAEDFGCRAWAIELKTNDRLDGIWVDWKMVRAEGWDSKNGSKWKTMPDQMFIYRAAAFWQRAYAPEISMGMNTVEELIDVIDVSADGSYTITTEELRAGTSRPAEVIDQDTGEVGKKNSPDEASTASAGPASETSSQAETASDSGLTFAKVADSLNKAKDLEVLDVAADLISAIEDPQQQDELRGIYKDCKKRLTNAAKPARGAAKPDPGVSLE